MYLLDADWIIQALANRQPALQTLELLAGGRVYVSYIAVGEVYERAFNSISPDAHLLNFRQFLSPYRILTLTDPIMERFAELRSFLRHRGQLIPDFDLLIGATALHYELTLLTFNRRDFQRIPDLKIYQPGCNDAVRTRAAERFGSTTMTVPNPAAEPNSPVRTVLWQRIDSPGSEWCTLEREAEGWRFQGIVLAAISVPVLVEYVVALASDWSTRAVEIVMRWGTESEPQTLKLTVTPDHHWQIDRGPSPAPSTPQDDAMALHGLVDVDLGFSPVTNTLPIRRLDPANGEAVAVTAAWVRFPELTIEPLPQRYIRLAERRYRYESAGGAFVAEIEVDDLGLVTTYEGGWQRIAVSPGH